MGLECLKMYTVEKDLVISPLQTKDTYVHRETQLYGVISQPRTHGQAFSPQRLSLAVLTWGKAW